MNDHSSLLIVAGVVVALTPFVLIGIGIARDYRATHQNRRPTSRITDAISSSVLPWPL